ncbi:hypothetical protein Patl1_15548 [Pistacia atlantica]|uniref:Uncharacterized protein n=1 Tax=Pistacia atlantica TaxID=434234 RepID=A0ACC1B6D5_9ROSI|nr:hypothetical protein Patl1_15548 [Pistacia atlantica]
MTVIGTFKALVSWISTGRLRQTVAGCIDRSDKTLNSGEVLRVKICPGFTGEGKLSALEAKGVDNCKIEIENLDCASQEVEVPIFDGSACAWVEAIQEVGVKEALDQHGNNGEKNRYTCGLWRNDSFIAAFPSRKVHITCGIDFPKVPAIGCQWFSSAPLDESVYEMQIASSRNFCIYEEVESMRNAGLIKGGSLENALICSGTEGWLNTLLQFPDEPCRRHKGKHALHTDFARCLSGINLGGNVIHCRVLCQMTRGVHMIQYAALLVYIF